jgi:uncharacterized protein
MQKLAPLMVGVLMTAWLGIAHAQLPDYIIHGNTAPMKPLGTELAASAPASVGSAPVSTAVVPASAPVAVVPPRAPAVAGKVRIGLLLPTQSKDFGEAAQVVRAGFEAAAAVDGKADVVYVDEQEHDVAARYRAAVASGVRVMVGPLTRQGIAAVAPYVTVPTLALNALEPGLPANPRLISLSLIVEGEARQMAHLMQDDGRQHPLVVSTSDVLSRRLTQAFIDEWKKQTGIAPEVLAWPFDASVTPDLSRADSLFIAMTPPEAAALKAAVPATMTVYATSQLDTRKPDSALAGVRFIDMPWFLMPEQTEVKRYPRPQMTLTMQTERLYALGIDAYRLAVMMAGGKWTPNTLRLHGVTGDLRLGRDRQFERSLPLAVMLPDSMR